jgi:dihydroorotase
MRALARKYPGVIVALKLRLTDKVLDPFKLHLEPLEEGVVLAEELGLPLVVHVNDPNTDIEGIAGLLRKGDVFCHMYAGARDNILDSTGVVKPAIKAARERGVIFDAANGRKNFLFKVALPAIKQGFLPDIISTDFNLGCQYKQPVISLPRLLSKYLAMGMDLYDVIDRATINPARWLGDTGLGSLGEGTAADIGIFKVLDKDLNFSDSAGTVVQGAQVLVPQLTIKKGVIMYSQSDFIK